MTNPNSFEPNGGDQRSDRVAADGRKPLARDEAGLFVTQFPIERAVLVGVEIRDRPGLLTLQDSLSELEALADTAELEVVGALTQKLDAPHPATLVGSGKVEELKTLVTELNASVVIFDEELSPRQQREIEEALGEEVKVLDRTALILDIFAQHARTREGAVQVELAQYEYRLPRLTRAWTHLARQSGGRAGGAAGGVGVRGPGETQLEVDRREINRRIAALKRELGEIQKQRRQHREQRRKNETPVIALVGYTNSGKSTLFNRLTGSDVFAKDMPFATLDPTIRRLDLPTLGEAALIDTVGFITDLPTHLIDSFQATLEESLQADLLIHVRDRASASDMEQAEDVALVLERLETESGLPLPPMIEAWNKMDALSPERAESLRGLAAITDDPPAAAVSALTGEGIDGLLALIEKSLLRGRTEIRLTLGPADGKARAWLHQYGEVTSEAQLDDGGVDVSARLSAERLGQFRVEFPELATAISPM